MLVLALALRERVGVSAALSEAVPACAAVTSEVCE
jgi:hypothetical protein